MNQSRCGPERSRKLILRWRPVSFFLPFYFCILLSHKHCIYIYIYIQDETELTRYMNIFVGFYVTKYVYIRIKIVSKDIITPCFLMSFFLHLFQITNVFSNGIAFYFLYIIVTDTSTVCTTI